MTIETNPAAAPTPAPADNTKAAIDEAVKLMAEPAAEPAPAAKETKPAEVNDQFTERFQKLASAQEQLRKEAEELKSWKEVAATVPPHKLKQLIGALSANDLKSALGMFGMKLPEEAAAPAKKVEEPAEVPAWAAAMKKELDELRAERERQSYEANRNAARTRVKGDLESLKLPVLSSLGEDAVDEVLEELSAIHQKNGGFSGPVEEVVQLAARNVEAKYAKLRERLLTAAVPPATVAPKAPASASGRENQTLHNGLAVPTAGSSKQFDEAVELVRQRFSQE